MFAARFDGKCSRCGFKTPKGTLIQRVAQGQYAHIACPKEGEEFKQQVEFKFEAPNIVLYMEMAKMGGLKWPKLRLVDSAMRPIVLSVAGEKSRNPGRIHITDGGRFGNNDYFGYITPEGQGVSRMAYVASVLRDVEANVVEETARIGKLTGHCCFCGKSIKTDESVEVGYGPDCAARWGLPWGGRERVPA